jgi:hypothetical protein
MSNNVGVVIAAANALIAEHVAFLESEIRLTRTK